MNIMKKIIIILLLLLTQQVKAPSLPEYYKLLKIHLHYLEQIELKKADELKKFLFHLSLIESSHDWKIINRFGYMGKYQFGNAALSFVGLGHITTSKFRNNPNIFPIYLQDIAVKRLLDANTKLLKHYIQYIGCTIKGTHISKSGLLAAAHLGGAGNVIEFLESEGRNDFKDGNKTQISEYIKEFANYKF